MSNSDLFDKREEGGVLEPVGQGLSEPIVGMQASPANTNPGIQEPAKVLDGIADVPPIAASDAPATKAESGIPAGASVVAEGDTVVNVINEETPSAPQSGDVNLSSDSFLISKEFKERIAKKPINVLVVDDESDMREFVQKILELTGLSKDHVFEAETVDEALDIVMKGIEDERSRIGWVLSDAQLKTKEDGVVLMEMLKDVGGSQPRPYLTGMSGKAPVIENMVKNTDGYIAKGSDVNFPMRILESFERAVNYNDRKPTVVSVEITQEMALSGGKVDDAQAEKDPVVPEGESNDLLRGESAQEGLIVIPESNKLNYYDRKDKLRDLAKPNDYPKGTRVALLDVDGTLAESFIMGRFARHLAHVFPQLLNDLPKSQRAKNQHALKGLLARVENIEKGTLPKNMPYEEMIREMDRLYREALTGLSVKKVCAIGAQWSKEDSKSSLYRYAKPIIELLKHLNIVPALVTGLPAEALSGYIDGLGGIEARCYPLELQTVKNEHGEMVYGEKIERETGVSNEKLAIARSIVDSGHDIYCAFGDQNSDLGMMRMATDIKKGNVAFGKAFYFADTKGTKFAGHMADINTSSSDSFGRRHLMVIDKELELFAMLEEIAHSFFRMERWFQYQKGMEDSTRIFRDKLHALVYHPYGKPDKDGNPIEKNGGFKQFTADAKKGK